MKALELLISDSRLIRTVGAKYLCNYSRGKAVEIQYEGWKANFYFTIASLCRVYIIWCVFPLNKHFSTLLIRILDLLQHRKVHEGTPTRASQPKGGASCSLLAVVCGTNEIADSFRNLFRNAFPEVFSPSWEGLDVMIASKTAGRL